MTREQFAQKLVDYLGAGEISEGSSVLLGNTNLFTPVGNKDEIIQPVMMDLNHHGIRPEFIAAQTYLSEALIQGLEKLSERMILFVAFGPYNSVTLHNEGLTEKSPLVASAAIIWTIKK